MFVVVSTIGATCVSSRVRSALLARSGFGRELNSCCVEFLMVVYFDERFEEVVEMATESSLAVWSKECGGEISAQLLKVSSASSLYDSVDVSELVISGCCCGAFGYRGVTKYAG